MIENYIQMFLNSPLAAEPASFFTLLMLFFGRMLPIIALSPFFGSRVLPHPVKAMFAITLFFLFLPQLLVVITTPINFGYRSIALLFKEFFIGYILGFLISIPFTIVQSAGMIIDHQRGGASLMVNDPTIQNQSSPLGTLFNMVLIYIFYVIDGPFLFIDAITTSFELVPPDQMINPFFFDAISPFKDVQIGLLNKAMKIAIQLATPALLAILMTDVFLGITNRLAPQVQITFLGLPLKSLLGLTIVCLGWKSFTSQMVYESYAWLKMITNVIQYLKPPDYILRP
jgi:type III secretion protein T